MTDQQLDELLDAWTAPDVPPSLRRRVAEAIPAKARRRFLGVRPRWILAFGLAACALGLGESLVTNATMGSDTGSWDSRTYWRRTRIVYPAISWLHWRNAKVVNTGATMRDGSFSGSKWLIDPSTADRRGYRWTAKLRPDGRYEFTTTRLESADPPSARIVKAGDAFDVDLYVNGRERIYDHYEIFAAPVEVVMPQTPATLTFASPRLYVNDGLVAGRGAVLKVAGEVLSASVPKRGYLEMALKSSLVPGFQATGKVHGNILQFDLEGEHWRLECSAPIAPQSDVDVYVLFKRNPSVKRGEFAGGRVF